MPSDASIPTVARRPARAAAMVGDGAKFSLLVIVVIAIIFPRPFFSFFVGNVFLSPVRVTLVLLCIPAAIMFFQRVKGKLYSYDYLFIACTLWTALCMFKNRGGILFPMQYLLEMLVVYMLAVGSVRTLPQLMFVIRLLFAIVLILLPLAIIEHFARYHIILDFFSRLAGDGPFLRLRGKERFGMIRVVTTFGHPILFGLYCASVFSLVFFSEIDKARRYFRAGVISFMTLLSLSSGPILCWMIQVGTIIVEGVTRGVRNRFAYIATGAAIFLTVWHFSVGGGVFRLAAILALNPATAYYRRMIWIHGIDDVKRNPIFGINPTNWTRPGWMTGSIDNFWLVQAMQSGYPGFLLLAAALIMLARCLWKAPEAGVPEVLLRLRRGWSYSMLGMAVAGGTVHFFDKIQPHFAMLIGLGAVIYRLMIEMREDPAQARAQAATTQAAPARRRTWL